MNESKQDHIEHYFPKGYNPDEEPWKSIKAFHKAAIEKATAEHQAEHDRLQVIIEKDTLMLLAEKEKSRVLGNLVDGLRAAAQKIRSDWQAIHLNGGIGYCVAIKTKDFDELGLAIDTSRAAQASEPDPDAAKVIERAQELVDMEEYPNL